MKLLRLIQEKTARPVGDQREQPVDVRILSATHKDLGELVAAGRFREDLYYRIDVIDLRVPSLRERLTDVPELAAAVTERFASRMGMATPTISDEAMALLATHDYPGNVRELENVIERALTLCDGGTIRPENFKLGTHKTVLVASVPEGDDKPYKYPGTYRGVDALVINKIDLLPYVPFRMDYFERGVQVLNPGFITFPLSCTTGEGLDAWVNWLIENAKR